MYRIHLYLYRWLFLLYSPLNQGLKLLLLSPDRFYLALFLLYSPLNQGLKQFWDNYILQETECFYSTVH